MNEQTIATIALFLPGLVSLALLFNYLFYDRNHTQNTLMCLLGMGVPYYVSYALYISPLTNYPWMCCLDIICQPLVLCMLAMLSSYVYAHNIGRPLSRKRRTLFMLPAVIHAALLWPLYAVIGLDNVIDFVPIYDATTKAHPTGYIFDYLPAQYNTLQWQMFYYVDNVLIRTLCGILFVVILWFCVGTLHKQHYKIGGIYSFFFKGGKTTPAKIACLSVLILLLFESPLLTVGRVMISDMPLLGIFMSIVLSLVVFFVSYCELYSDLPYHTLYSLCHMSPYRFGAMRGNHYEGDDDEVSGFRRAIREENERLLRRLLEETDRKSKNSEDNADKASTESKESL